MYKSYKIEIDRIKVFLKLRCFALRCVALGGEHYFNSLKIKKQNKY